MPTFAYRLFSIGFWCMLIATTVLSLLPVDELPSLIINWWDKAQHALGFAVLTGLGLLGYRQHYIRLVAGLLVYGVAIELAQAVSGWRTGDVMDWLADATGIGIAYLLARLLGLQQRSSSPTHRQASS